MAPLGIVMLLGAPFAGGVVKRARKFVFVLSEVALAAHRGAGFAAAGSKVLAMMEAAWRPTAEEVAADREAFRRAVESAQWTV